MNAVFKFIIAIIAIALLGVGLAYVVPSFLGVESFGGLVGGSVALIKIDGAISVSGGISLNTLSTSASSNDIVAYLERAEKTSSISAVVLEINSPGGGAVAGMEIAQKIKSMDIPVIAWIRETGTSAAYIIASACNAIVAHDFSLVGNLGTTMSYISFGHALDDYNITYNRITSGVYKDIGSPYKEATDEELEMLQKIVNEINEGALEFVRENRHQILDWDDVITAKIYTGKEALEAGLVDYLGTKDVLTDVVKNITGLSSVSYISLAQQIDLWSLLTG